MVSLDLTDFYSISCYVKKQKFEDPSRGRARRVSRCFDEIWDGKLGADPHCWKPLPNKWYHNTYLSHRCKLTTVAWAAGIGRQSKYEICWTPCSMPCPKKCERSVYNVFATPRMCLGVAWEVAKRSRTSFRTVWGQGMTDKDSKVR